MNKALKCAWFNLAVTLLLASLHGAAFILIFKIGYVPRVLNTIGFVIVFGVLGITAVVFQRKQKLSEIEIDERDRFISKKVLAVDYFLLWSLLIGGCVAVWFLMGPEGTVKVYALCFLLYVSFLVAMLVHSGATIILYRQGISAVESILEEGENNE